MPATAILQEAQKLHSVSDRLVALAGEHPVVSDALVTIYGKVHHAAALLELLVLTKMGSLFQSGMADA